MVAATRRLAAADCIAPEEEAEELVAVALGDGCRRRERPG